MKPKILLTNWNTVLVAGILLTTAGCATTSTTKTRDSHSGDRYIMAGYEFSARKGVDTQQSIRNRFGPPLSEESPGSSGQFKILSYPAKDHSEKLLLLFLGEELIGVFRESARQSLNHTMVSYERHVSGRRALFQANYPDNVRVQYSVEHERLARTPKMRSNQPPLSESDAAALAVEWRNQNQPNFHEHSPRLQLHHIKDLPGIAYYSVDIAPLAPRPEHRKIMILMDGTVISGELEPK